VTVGVRNGIGLVQLLDCRQHITITEETMIRLLTMQEEMMARLESKLYVYQEKMDVWLEEMKYC
jgi:hypothetical protein